ADQTQAAVKDFAATEPLVAESVELPDPPPPMDELRGTYARWDRQVAASRIVGEYMDTHDAISGTAVDDLEIGLEELVALRSECESLKLPGRNEFIALLNEETEDLTERIRVAKLCRKLRTLLDDAQDQYDQAQYTQCVELCDQALDGSYDEVFDEDPCVEYCRTTLGAAKFDELFPNGPVDVVRTTIRRMKRRAVFEGDAREVVARLEKEAVEQVRRATASTATRKWLKMTVASSEWSGRVGTTADDTAWGDRFTLLFERAPWDEKLRLTVLWAGWEESGSAVHDFLGLARGEYESFLDKHAPDDLGADHRRSRDGCLAQSRLVAGGIAMAELNTQARSHIVQLMADVDGGRLRGFCPKMERLSAIWIRFQTPRVRWITDFYHRQWAERIITQPAGDLPADLQEVVRTSGDILLGYFTPRIDNGGAITGYAYSETPHGNGFAIRSDDIQEGPRKPSPAGFLDDFRQERDALFANLEGAWSTPHAERNSHLALYTDPWAKFVKNIETLAQRWDAYDDKLMYGRANVAKMGSWFDEALELARSVLREAPRWPAFSASPGSVTRLVPPGR
ncbi:MAG: hypothetical protein HQ581_18500, partial [Planctomycetes bacterium]|nr:hypothetical protein [Planctomycetota bacterium]